MPVKWGRWLTKMEEIVLEIAKRYGKDKVKILQCIDSSKGDMDIRFNYVIYDNASGKRYVIKINSSSAITEAFVSNINLIVCRYKTIGIWAPSIKKSWNGRYVETITFDEIEYKCYMEEYAVYRMVEKYDEQFVLEVCSHLGKLAAKYTGVELMEQPSMWTIIQRHPLDGEIDEKQDNLNVLCHTLKSKGFELLAEQMQSENKKCRDKISEVFEELPRCVYQGDLNQSNLLQDEKGHFAGLIDFNMAGTEVNINCFLNETAYQLEETDFQELAAEQIYEKMLHIQNNRLAYIFKHYKLNKVENRLFDLYRKIINLSFYPNVMCLKYLVEKDMYVDKVTKLLKRICEGI